ncbi:MAG: membrane protein insertase YidC [Planctomycetota bacterium]
MMTVLIIQGMWAPQQDANDPNQDPAVVAEQDPQADGVVPAEDNLSADDDQADQKQDSPDDVESEDADAVPPAAIVNDDFYKIGSLNKDGSDRYLITVNRKAGTIHRVEINARDEKGRFRYRDLVFEGGYLGSPNLLRTDKGLEVNAVGAHTPAAAAGLTQGDILLSLTDAEGSNEAMVTAEDVDLWLNKKTKPGQQIKLGIERNGLPMTLNATLTQKPISIIRPEGDLVDDEFDYPESFVFSLLKPQEYFERAWPDVDPTMRDGRWEVTERSHSQMVELKFEVRPGQLEQFAFNGPITIYKRFSLPQLNEEDRLNIDSRTFHIDFEIEIVNGSAEPIELAYELNGPTGLSAETWWYANKIHGRQTAIGYTAGARDVVAATGTNSYAFLGCPEIVQDAKKAKPETHFFCDPTISDPNEHQLKFAGVDSHYFNVSLLPVTDDEFLYVNMASAFPNHRQGQLPKIPKNVRLQRLVDCTFQLAIPAAVPANGSYKQSFEIFCGPKDPVVLDDYGLSDVRTFGWFSFFAWLLLEILHFFYWITFKTSYGLAIILLTVVVRCFMIPFSRRAALNAQMMQYLAPQIKEISEKYKDDMEKRAEAQRELYKKYNFNPLGGCFMMFFQLPIFYGLYKGLNVDIALRDQALIPGINWCSNLAAPDQLLYWKDWMPGWLADETGYLGPYLNILPLLTMVLFIVQQKLFTPPATDDQQKFMQKMMTFMMLFMGILFFKVPAGLCIYFITSSLWGIIERKLLPKPVLDTDRFSDEPIKSKSKKELRTEEREELARQEELEARKKRNAERKKKLKKRQS